MTIRSKLIISFLIISLAPLLATNIITYSINKKKLTQSIINHLESVASIQHHRIEEIVLQNLERLQLVTSRTQLRFSLEKFTRSGDPVHQEKMNQIVRDALDSIDDFKQICVCDPEGTIVASTERTRIGKNIQDSEWFRSGRTNNRVDMFILDDNKRLNVNFSGPLWLNNILLGVLVIESSAEKLLTSVGDYTGLGETGETVLVVYKNDTTPVFLTPTRFNAEAALHLTVPRQMIPPDANTFTHQQKVLVNAVDYRGQPILAVSRYVETTGWRIIVKIDKAEAFLPLRNMRILVVVVITVSIFLVILVARFLARGITEPIARLTGVAQKISQGDYEELADETSSDEVGILARAFNKMTTTLIKIQDNLQQNITEIHESENRFRLLMDSLDALVYVTDIHTYEILFINEYGKKIMGDVTGKICWEYLQQGQNGPCDFCPNKYIVDKDGDPGEIYTWECQNASTGRWFYMRDRAIKWADGRIVHLQVATDISEKKSAEEVLRKNHYELEQMVEQRTLELKKTYDQLLHAEKLSAIGRLSASIAHEFNNPLQGVMSVIRGIRRRGSIKEQDQELVSLAIEECNRMRDLIKNLQDFNRPTSGRLSSMDIHAAIDSIILLGKKEYKSRHITIKKIYAETMPQVTVVADQIKQVILNILNNASDACEKGGTITIRTEVHEDGISVSIQDTGTGISPGDKEHIFEPFFSTKPEVKGTGLGLSVSYGIIKRHGGRITVESETGQGTTFTFTLPLSSARGLAEATATDQVRHQGDEPQGALSRARQNPFR